MLWFALNDPHLSGTALKLILDSDYEKLVSPASYWEIAIKISLNKYVLSQSYESFMPTAIDENGFGYMHIEPRHTAMLTNLPFHHRDPFDRLLVAQAMVEATPIISQDQIFDNYGISRLW